MEIILNYIVVVYVQRIFAKLHNFMKILQAV